MSTSSFNAKHFHSDAFGKYVSQIPCAKRDELLRAKAFVPNAEIRSIFSKNSAASYGVVPLFNALSGTAQNYDGVTDIAPAATDMYEIGVNVVGRAKAWSERDFVYDPERDDYMDSVAKDVALYWENIDMSILLSVLKGIFAMEDETGATFVTEHTLDLTGNEGDAACVGAATLNTAINKACGENKGKFSVAILHSQVATNLENLQLLHYMTCTENGMTRDIALASWNGRAVIVDDSVPCVTDGDKVQYTSYILGENAFFYEDIGAKVPYEMERDPLTKGGTDTLFTRQRKVIHPYGMTYKKAEQSSLSPTNDELAAAANWGLAEDSEQNAISHKLIPIARIISVG